MLFFRRFSCFQSPLQSLDPGGALFQTGCHLQLSSCVPHSLLALCHRSACSQPEAILVLIASFRTFPRKLRITRKEQSIDGSIHVEGHTKLWMHGQPSYPQGVNRVNIFLFPSLRLGNLDSDGNPRLRFAPVGIWRLNALNAHGKDLQLRARQVEAARRAAAEARALPESSHALTSLVTQVAGRAAGVAGTAARDQVASYWTFQLLSYPVTRTGRFAFAMRPR